MFSKKSKKPKKSKKSRRAESEFDSSSGNCSSNSSSSSDSEEQNRKRKRKKDSKSKKKKTGKTKKKHKQHKHKHEKKDSKKNDQKHKTETVAVVLAKPGPIVTLASGGRGKVTKQIIHVGSGQPARNGQIMTLHCTAYFTRKKVVKQQFWTTRGITIGADLALGGESASVRVPAVLVTEESKPYLYRVGEGKQIEGWVLAVPTMRLHERAVVEISANYAYGSEGLAVWKIPPNADLTYELELLAINN